MIAAGEVSGKLDESLSAVIQMKKHAMNSKIRGAMVIPWLFSRSLWYWH